MSEITRFFSKEPKYLNLSDVQNTVGFIVNVHDQINFDIDLNLNSKIKNRYSRVIINEYCYTDPSSEGIRRGLTYRCRLRGVSLDSKDKYSKMLQESRINILRKIDRQNGWAICTVSDVDIYNRILVDLYDPITGESINEYLLTQYKEIYRPYNGHR